MIPDQHRQLEHVSGLACERVGANHDCRGVTGLDPSPGGAGHRYPHRGAESTPACVSAIALRRAHPSLRLPLDIVPIALIAGGAGFGAGRLVGIHPLIEVGVGACVYALMLVGFRRVPPEIAHALESLWSRNSR